MDATDPKDVMARFGRALRRRRLAAQLGQEAFADKVGMHRTTCSLIERGLQSPTLVMVARMAAALETTMASLVADAERPDPPANPPSMPSGRRARKSDAPPS